MKKGTDYTGVTVVYFCHDGEGDYLLAKRGLSCRDEQGTWDTGGGALELHDTVEGTLRREVEEEYGTQVLAYEFLGYRDVHRVHEGRPTHWIALDFKVEVDRQAAHNAEPEKFDEIGWFRMDALPAPLHSQLPGTIASYPGRL